MDDFVWVITGGASEIDEISIIHAFVQFPKTTGPPLVP